MAAWFETLFDDRYPKFYPELFDLDVADREAAFVDRALSLPSGASLLDLGCVFSAHFLRRMMGERERCEAIGILAELSTA